MSERRRVSYTQLLHLWEFLNSHREVAVGYNKSAQAREHSREMWLRAASILNSIGEGAIKSGPEWSKYWVDFKAKIKRKNRIIRDARSRTGGGPSTEQELTEIEVKFLQILGEDYGSGLPGVRVEPIIIQLENVDGLAHSHHSQSVQSEEGSEAPIYLDIMDSNEQENIIHEAPIPQLPSTSAQSTNLPTPPPTTNQPTNLHQPSPLRTPSPQPQQTPPVPSVPADSRGGPLRRRRLRRRRTLTAAEAREQLVLASQARAQAELANSSSLAEAVRFLGEMSATLKRIEERMPGASGAPTGE